jgi:transcriptional regulator with XRE-family HTH domain
MKLRELRVEQDLSQARLAARAGVDPSTVNQIERGARQPSPATLRKLAGALGVGIAELLHEGAALEEHTGGPFTAVYQTDGEWWLGYVEELSGANAQERSLEECRESLREAVEDILDANRELTKREFDGGDVVREPIGA